MVYLFNKDKLPPRTPYKVARNISELNIKRDFHVQKFEERWDNFSGDGYALVIFSLSKKQYSNIYNQCLAKRYDTLPFERIPDYEILNYVNDTSGLYNLDYLTSQEMDFNLTVLDKTNKKLLIMTRDF
jgi:hypothetical protein